MLRTKGGLHSKLYAVCDDTCTPVRLLLTEEQTNGETPSAQSSPAKPVIADCGYDADRLITALKKQGVKRCIPPCKNRKSQRRSRNTLHLAASGLASILQLFPTEQ